MNKIWTKKDQEQLMVFTSINSVLPHFDCDYWTNDMIGTQHDITEANKKLKDLQPATLEYKNLEQKIELLELSKQLTQHMITAATHYQKKVIPAHANMKKPDIIIQRPTQN